MRLPIRPLWLSSLGLLGIAAITGVLLRPSFDPAESETYRSTVATPPAEPASQPFRGPTIESRTALVVGNGAYGNDAGLPNAANDAKAIADALRQLGFRVLLHLDLDQNGMEEAVRTFADTLRGQGGVGLFYYSGHGFQAGGRSYLAPVGARIASETDARFKTLDVEYVLGQMEEAGSRMNIVILDACRDNPFSRSFRTRGGQQMRGLSQVEAPVGTLIAYATSPGKTAADGWGKHSPYTSALLEVIRSPGVPLEQTFKEVRIRVAEATHNVQIPWESSSLLGEFFFLPQATAALATPAPVEKIATEATTIPRQESAPPVPSPTPSAQAPVAPPRVQTAKPAASHPPPSSKLKKSVQSAVKVPARDPGQGYFEKQYKDIESFLKTPAKTPPPPRKSEQGGDYFKKLSKDVDSFLRN